jgi:hypothetical protein
VLKFEKKIRRQKVNLAIGRLSSRDILPGLANSVFTLPLAHIVQYDVDWRWKGATLLATPAQNSRVDGRLLPHYTPWHHIGYVVTIHAVKACGD